MDLAPTVADIEVGILFNVIFCFFLLAQLLLSRQLFGIQILFFGIHFTRADQPYKYMSYPNCSPQKHGVA